MVDRVAYVRMNRPRVLNAINRALHDGIMDGLRQAGGMTTSRRRISGNGKSFSAGGDLKESAAWATASRYRSRSPTRSGITPKPVIAAVHGYCLGHAFEIAAVCDLTVAAQSATFGEVQINHGGSPPILITPQSVGIQHAKEILLLGEVFDADFAFRVGLVNRVVPDDQLDAEVAKITSPVEPASTPARWRRTNASSMTASSRPAWSRECTSRAPHRRPGNSH